MKKKLEAELISIAHRILKLKNKSELIQLHQEAQKLYEKLSVLLFVEQNFAGVQPTIGHAEIVEKLDVIFDKDEKVAAVKVEDAVVENKVKKNNKEDEVLATKSVEEPIAETEDEEEPVEKYQESIEAETKAEESKPEPTFKPSFELSFETKEDEAKEEIKPEKAQISFEDLLGPSYVDPVFVKPEDAAKNSAEQSGPTGETAFVSASELISNYKAQSETKSHTLNDRLAKGITIGLNDRMAFIKHLFAGSDEDYNRVLSQLITFDTFVEAQSFIDDMVKPDYHNWDGKDEYSKRFMEIIERKFS